jgi:polysaccharide biosynthesis/export protein
MQALIGGLAALLLVLLIGPAARAQQPAPAPVTAPAAQPARPLVAQPAQAMAPADYRIGAGDVLRITVFQNPELSLETRVSEGGQISYPLLGPVAVGGLTAQDAERRLADALRNGNFVRNPQVTLLVLQVRGHQVSVLGQVVRPGRYPLDTTEMRLTEVLALAGGVGPGGADLVVITGTRDGKPLRLEFDLPAMFLPGATLADPKVLNGDTVWVDRQPLVYIYGEVQRPGPMRLEREMTLLQALATGGGLTQRGTDKGIKVHRKGEGGKVQVIEPGMTDLLREGDVVFVRESLF